MIEPVVFQDPRGFFMETYKRSEFIRFGLKDFLQSNHSKSTYAVLRGLHYQKDPMAQGKLMKVIQGEVFDVAVDIRQGSPTYGQWVSAMLSAENKRMLYIPVGFAHGFCVTTETAEVLYQTTEEYSPEYEGGIIWNDPEINIHWPIPEPIVSKRDTILPPLSQCKSGFSY
jgi:dTDP-4-dehydrorhamnose 3,5-epimerase